MQEYLSTLNKEQYLAATTVDGPLLILAGAGTGKTKTLVSRVAYMLDSGIAPENILLLTFTNKAAKEMVLRIKKAIGEKAQQVTACTFHSFCTRILRANAEKIDFKPGFTIIDQQDAREIIRTFIDDSVKGYQAKGVKCESFPSASTILSINGILTVNTKSIQK